MLGRSLQVLGRSLQVLGRSLQVLGGSLQVLGGNMQVLDGNMRVLGGTVLGFRDTVPGFRPSLSVLKINGDCSCQFLPAAEYRANPDTGMIYGAPTSLYGSGLYSAGDAPVSERKRMAKIALKLKDKELGEKVALSISLETNMATAPNLIIYPTPNPPLATLAAKRGEIAAQLVLRSAAVTTLETIDMALETLDGQLEDLLRQEGAYIQEKSGGVESKIVATGAEVQGAATPPQQLGAVQNLRLTGGDLDGEIDGQSNPLRGRDFYEVECATAVNGPFTLVYSGKKSSWTATNLVSGQNYFFRMRGKNSVGNGVWSDIAMKRAT